jgi:hypothetical protein
MTRGTALNEAVAPDYPFVLPLETGRWAEIILSLRSEPRRAVSDWAISTTWDDVAAEYLSIFEKVHAVRH